MVDQGSGLSWTSGQHGRSRIGSQLDIRPIWSIKDRVSVGYQANMVDQGSGLSWIPGQHGRSRTLSQLDPRLTWSIKDLVSVGLEGQEPTEASDTVDTKIMVIMKDHY